MESGVVKQEFEVKKEFLGLDGLMIIHPNSKLPLIQHIVSKSDDTKFLDNVRAGMANPDEKYRIESQRIVAHPIPKANEVKTIHIFAAYGYADAVRTFVELGADPKTAMITNEGESLTPLMLAARYDHHDVANFLAGGAAEVFDWNTLTDFFNMKQTAQDLARVVLPNGATALHIFCALGYTDLVKDLLKLNINKTSLMTAKNGSKYSPIMLAMLFGHNKIVKLLLKNVAMTFSKELLNIPGAPTLLEIACRLNNLDMVQLLLEKGVNPNHRYHDLNKTALYWAVVNNNVEICETLLFAGTATNSVMQGRDEEELINVTQAIKAGETDTKIVSLLTAFDDAPAKLLKDRIAQHIRRAMQECAAKDKAGIKSEEYIKGAALLKAVIAADMDEGVNLVKAHFTSLPKATIKGYDFSLFDQLLANFLTNDPDFCEQFHIKVNGLGNFADRRPRMLFVEALQKSNEEKLVEAPEVDALPPSANSFGAMVEEPSAKPELKKPSGPGFFERLFSLNGKKATPPLAPATDVLKHDQEDEVIVRSHRSASAEDKVVEPKKETVSEPVVMVEEPIVDKSKHPDESDTEDYIDGYTY